LPFFFEPAFNAKIEPLEAAKGKIAQEGWKLDKHSKTYSQVRYGDFLLGKVSGNFFKPAESRNECGQV
jgi:isopenicillin N synthase-like dioxygenase